MIVFLDRQHVGQISHIKSMGAAADLDHNGETSISETEAYWTGYLSLALETNLREMGHDVISISDGSYQERHSRVNEYTARYNGKACYFALHLNAGGGSYGAMFYDYRSTAGSILADKIAESMERELREISTVKKIPASPADWTKNAYYTIKGVGAAVAICSEPLFIDNDQHQKLLTYDGISKLAWAMAKGIDQWSRI
jgi:hypothetical protein